MPTSISFTRQYNGYTGGHQKVRDYLDHALSDPRWDVHLYQENNAVSAPPLFSEIPRVTYQTRYDPSDADVVFLAGEDWQRYLPFYQESQLKINLIQHVRHADPEQPLFDYLQYPAHRICVSAAVENAIAPFANGPISTIKMGHEITTPRQTRSQLLYILATKQPKLGAALADWASAQGYSHTVDLTVKQPEAIHAQMAKSVISIVLPHTTEGFFLPGIEAMWLSDYAVVPDCIANREYCKKFSNAITCELTLVECQNAIQRALEKSRNRWISTAEQWVGRRIVSTYTRAQERKHFLKILNSLTSA